MLTAVSAPFWGQIIHPFSTTLHGLISRCDTKQQISTDLDSGHDLLGDCSHGAAAASHTSHAGDGTKELSAVELLPHTKSPYNNQQNTTERGAVGLLTLTNNE